MSASGRDQIVLIFYVALYFSLCTPSRSLESDEDRCIESVDCGNNLPSSCLQAQSCSILINQAVVYAYSDEVVSFTGTYNSSCPAVTNLECYVNGCKSWNTSFAGQTLRCDVCTNANQTTEVAFRAFHHQKGFCSDTAYLHPIGKPPKVTDLTYKLDCRGFIVSWNHSLVNTTHFLVTVTSNEEKLYQNTTKNTSFYYTTVGWNRSAEYEVTVQAVNPSGASLATTKNINLNKNSDLDITKHLVRMNDNGLPTIQVTFGPFAPDCPLRRPHYLHAFIACHYEGKEQRHMRLSAEIKDGESSVILNLKEIRTSRHCEATLSIHGRNLSAFDFSMFDVQNVTMTVDGNFVLVQCIYALNSQARGCCIKSATQKDLNPLWIERNISTTRPFGPLRNGSHHFIVSSSQRCDFTEVDYTTTISLMYSSNETNRKDASFAGPIAGAVVGAILVLFVIVLLVGGVLGSIACYRHFTSKKRTIKFNEDDGHNESQRETDLSQAVSESTATVTDDSFTNLLSDHKKGENELVRNKLVIPNAPPDAVLSVAPRPIPKRENEFEMTSKEPNRETGEGLSKVEVPSAQTKPEKISQLVPAPPPTTQNKANTVFSKVPPTCRHDGDMGYLQNGIPESEN